MFHRTDFGGFLVRCYKAIQQLNGVETNSVAISLMLNHNLTGLYADPGGTLEKLNNLKSLFSRNEDFYISKEVKESALA